MVRSVFPALLVAPRNPVTSNRDPLGVCVAKDFPQMKEVSLGYGVPRPRGQANLTASNS